MFNIIGEITAILLFNDIKLGDLSVNESSSSSSSVDRGREHGIYNTTPN